MGLGSIFKSAGNMMGFSTNLANSMGGGSASVPTFDYKGAIQEQAKQNRVNTYNPYASTVFNQTPDGRWTSNTSFSPEVKNIWSRQMDITGNPDAYKHYQDQAFAQSRRLLDPYYQQQSRTFEQQMANRGLPVGGEAYDDAYANMSDAQNRAYEEAAFNALNFGEQARMNDYNRLAQILANAQGVQTTPIDVTGPMGMNYQGQLQNSQMQQQQMNNLWNAAGGLGAAYMLSSGDFKDETGEIPEDVLDRLMSVGVKRWAYKWDDRDHIGPYAEDFNEAFDLPESKQINIIDMMGVMMASIQELAKEFREIKRAVH